MQPTNTEILSISNRLSGRYPPYTALVFMFLSIRISKRSNGEYETTIKDIRRRFTYMVGRRPVIPSYKVIRDAIYRLWEDGILDFTTNQWGISARFLSEDDKVAFKTTK